MARVIEIEGKEYTILDEKTKDLDVYFHTSFEDLKGYISDKNSEELFDLMNSINKCSCGGDIELHEYECMGDGSYQIICKNCGRELERNQYDHDIKKWDDVLDFCIRDWNNGLNSENIKKANEDARNKKRLTKDDLIWKDWLANNIIGNPKEGIYCLLFSRNDDGIYCCKWTIEYQHKEKSPMCVTDEIESYNLFINRYFDVKGPLEYPEPTEGIEYINKDITFPGIGVNDKGDFVRNYKTIEDAIQGALGRCGWRGLNKETILKDVSGKSVDDFLENN